MEIDTNSVLAGAGVAIVFMGAIWAMFAHYDNRNERRTNRLDSKIDTSINDLRNENREAHKGITERLDKVLERMSK